jgi:hypothetical protein
LNKREKAVLLPILDLIPSPPRQDGGGTEEGEINAGHLSATRTLVEEEPLPPPSDLTAASSGLLLSSPPRPAGGRIHFLFLDLLSPYNSSAREGRLTDSEQQQDALVQSWGSVSPPAERQHPKQDERCVQSKVEMRSASRLPCFMRVFFVLVLNANRYVQFAH